MTKLFYLQNTALQQSNSHPAGHFLCLPSKCNFSIAARLMQYSGCKASVSSHYPSTSFIDSLISEHFCPRKTIAFDFMPEQIEIDRSKNPFADYFVGDCSNRC
jgi:hypothetical protein